MQESEKKDAIREQRDKALDALDAIARGQIKPGVIRVKVYPVLRRAVEEGVAYGYHRAYKHTDSPTEQQVKDEIEQAVMNELCEAFVIDDGEDSDGV